MKFVALLISIYVLYMVSVPCIDGASCMTNTHADHTSHHEEPADHNDADGCSPFCICTCCSVTVILTAFHFESDPSYTPVIENIPLNQGLTSTFFQHIWQPPKIS